jgi:hypothetical protein
MIKDFILPDKWRIKAKSTKEAKVINQYARDTGGSHWNDSDNYASIVYLCVDKGKYDLGTNVKSVLAEYTEITFTEFENYVLGIYKQPIDNSKTELQRFNELILAIKSK